jgi:hypothetical protein
MIKLEVIDDEAQHFLLSADEPVRVEVLPVKGRIVAHVYPGDAVDVEQEPIGAYDGTIDNYTWEASSDR